MLNLEVQNLSSLPCNGYFAILRVMVSRDVVPWGSGVLLLFDNILLDDKIL